MAENKKSFILYCDLIHTVEKLPVEKAGELFLHILKYVNDKNPQTDDLLIQISFEPIKQQLKRDLNHWKDICVKRSESGKMGGRPKKQTKAKKANALLEKQTKAKKADNDTETDNDNDTGIDNEIKKKIKYAEFVSMTEEEYQKLITGHGEKNTKVFIEILNNYKGSNGKKYKSDYLTILNWVIDKAKKDNKYVSIKPKFVA